MYGCGVEAVLTAGGAAFQGPVASSRGEQCKEMVAWVGIVR